MDADGSGDGGGLGSSRGEPASSESAVGEVAESESPTPLGADRELLPDFTDVASERSTTSVSTLLRLDVEFRGLSFLPPGILDLRPRKDLVDSFVSALLKEGYDERFSAPLSSEADERLPRGVLSPEPLELWFPISVCVLWDLSAEVSWSREPVEA